MTPKVLVIDDDLVILDIVKLSLSHHQFNVETASSGEEGIRLFYEMQPDLVILDLMMPGLSGWEVCQTLRLCSDIPIIFLSALDQVDQIVTGLECGAADYMTKPFDMRVLLARVKAALRRANMVAAECSTYGDAYLAIDLDRRCVSVRGKAAQLSLKEFDLLSYLVQNAGRALTFRQILTQVWGEQYRGDDAYVHVYIHHLRQKLEPDPKQPAYILTIPGRGYRFAKLSA